MNNYLLGSLFGSAFIAGVGAYLTFRKVNKTLRKVDDKIDVIDDNCVISVEDYVINEAVDRAVDREVEKRVERSAKTAVDAVKSDLEAKVRKEVRDAYSNIQAKVAEEVARQVNLLDIKDLEKKAKDLAAEKYAAKLDSSMDGILDKFNGELDSVSKIYKSIANGMHKSDSDGKMHFTVG